MIPETLQTATAFVIHSDHTSRGRLEVLCSRLEGPHGAVMVSAAEADEHRLDPFEKLLHAAPPSCAIRLIHIVDGDAGDAAAESIRSADEDMRKRCPQAHNISTWLVLRLARGWDDHERALAGAALAAGTRSGRVATVTTSTRQSVAGNAADESGMVADAAWALGPGGFLPPGDRVDVWALGTSSFAINSWASLVASAAKGVLDGLQTGIMGPSAGNPDDGIAWVQEQRIGSASQRADFLAGAGIDSVCQRVASAVTVAPQSWADFITVQYTQASGAPLAEAKRIIRRNAQVALRAMPGRQSKGGLTSAFDVRLLDILHSDSGLRKAGAFVHGVAMGLDNAARDAAAARPDFDPEATKRAEKKLRRQVASLPDTIGALLRWTLAATLLVVAGIAFFGGELLGGWSGRLMLGIPLIAAMIATAVARNSTIRARAGLEHTLRQRIQWKLETKAVEEQKRLIADLQKHVGSLITADGTRTGSLDEAILDTADTETACAADEVLRLFIEFSALIESIDGQQGFGLPSHPDVVQLGKWARVHPEASDREKLFSEPDRGNFAVGREAAEDVGRSVQLGESRADIMNRLASYLEESSKLAPIDMSRAIADPLIRNRVVASLQTDNAPDVSPIARTRSVHVRNAVILPSQLADELGKDLPGSALGAMQILVSPDSNFAVRLGALPQTLTEDLTIRPEPERVPRASVEDHESRGL